MPGLYHLHLQYNFSLLEPLRSPSMKIVLKPQECFLRLSISKIFHKNLKKANFIFRPHNKDTIIPIHNLMLKVEMIFKINI